MNTTASAHFVSIIKDIVNAVSTPIRIAEIGVDRGATTLEVIKLLRKGDIYDLFDLDCPFFRSHLNSGTFSPDCKIVKHESSRRLFDSYAWEIATILAENTKAYTTASIWDAVYLDGAHTFHVDAPTAICLKELVKEGGYIVLDDMYWTLKGSPTCNTFAISEKFTNEQFCTPHVKLIADAFMRTDPRFAEITKPSEPRAIFQKIINNN